MVTDYDWVEEASKIYYPVKQNLEIEGIKWPSKAKGKIEDNYD